MELVSKLQELGLLSSGLLHSIQGKEYITAHQLCEEIKHAVSEAGGRLAIVRSPPSPQAIKFSKSKSSDANQFLVLMSISETNICRLICLRSWEWTWCTVRDRWKRWSSRKAAQAG